MSHEKALDDILQHVGFGKKQIIAFLSICLLIIFHSATHMGYLFTAMDSDYRCSVPYCDNELNPKYDSDWIPNAIPSNSAGKLRKCEMYAKISTNGSCSAENFNTSQIVQCSSHIFKDDEFYINRKYDILCEENRWKLSLVGSTSTIGMLFGLPIGGFLSDRYGRKMILLIGLTLGGITGFLRIFSPTFALYCFVEFLDAFLTSGSHQSGYILSTELVIPEYRAWMVSIFCVFSAFGQMCVALIAWMWKDWRVIIYVVYIPLMFTFCFYWFIPESIRWYSSKGKLEEAMETLKKLTNKTSVPTSYFHSLERSFLEKEKKNKSITFVEMLKSNKLLLRLIACYIIWMSSLFVWYGLVVYSVALTTNPYLNVCLVSISEMIACLTIPIFVDKFGRKTFILGANILSISSCLACIFVESKTLHLIIYCVGKYGCSMAFLVIMMVTSEVFPTPVRHSTMATCSMVGRFGAMLSPQITLLTHVWQPLPFIVMATTSIVYLLLVYFLIPETLNVKLPDTIEEAEKIGEKIVEIEISDVNKMS